MIAREKSLIGLFVALAISVLGWAGPDDEIHAGVGAGGNPRPEATDKPPNYTELMNDPATIQQFGAGQDAAAYWIMRHLALQGQRVPYIRYFDLSEFAQCENPTQCFPGTMRAGLIKALNSLSFNPDIISPPVGSPLLGTPGAAAEFIDSPRNMILAVDIRYLRWDVADAAIRPGMAANKAGGLEAWNMLKQDDARWNLNFLRNFSLRNPGTNQQLARAAFAQTLSAGDFISRGMRGLPYKAFMRIPDDQKILERSILGGQTLAQRLTLANLQRSGQAAQTGVYAPMYRTGLYSNTEAFNRLLDYQQQVPRNRELAPRDGRALGYWVSKNFENNKDADKNVFNGTFLTDIRDNNGNLLFPNAQAAFADSDQIIELPNGSHMYVTYNNEGAYDADANADNGLRCMSCHHSGLIPYTDQLRPSYNQRQGYYHANFYARNPQQGIRGVVATESLLVGNDILGKMTEDTNKAYAQTRRAMDIDFWLNGEGGRPGNSFNRDDLARTDPTTAAATNFQDGLVLPPKQIIKPPLTIQQAAASLGITVQQLYTVVQTDPTLTKELGSLLILGKDGAYQGVIGQDLLFAFDQQIKNRTQLGFFPQYPQGFVPFGQQTGGIAGRR